MRNDFSFQLLVRCLVLVRTVSEVDVEHMLTLAFLAECGTIYQHSQCD